MLYKDDWDKAQERLDAWWAGETLDRPIIMVYAPRNGATPSSRWNNWNFPHNLGHPELAIDAFEEHCRATYFGGESYPNQWVNFGPGVGAAFMGAHPDVRDDTVWFETPRAWEELTSDIVPTASGCAAIGDRYPHVAATSRLQ